MKEKFRQFMIGRYGIPFALICYLEQFQACCLYRLCYDRFLIIDDTHIGRGCSYKAVYTGIAL